MLGLVATLFSILAAAGWILLIALGESESEPGSAPDDSEPARLRLPALAALLMVRAGLY